MPASAVGQDGGMTIMSRAAVAGALTIASLAAAAVPAAAAPGDQISRPLRAAIEHLPVATEDRSGYNRDLFRHWVDADRDGCSTRAEVLLEEATVAPDVTGRCTISGGEWHSWYDNTTVNNARSLDIDHMVPLAEAWDSGASDWVPGEREEYANDLGDARSLVAVTARSNRSKADQDPAEWLPPDTSATCQYVADWVAVKTRWGLAVDAAEQETLARLADGCLDVTVRVTLAR